MTPQTLPTPPAADIAVAAIAKAAALLALEEHNGRGSGPTRDDVEAIAEECVRRAFLRFGVDLSSPDSVESFRETLAHAKRARGWWEKAGTTVWGAIIIAATSFVLAAISRHVPTIGGK